ncbi:hypothetical protein M440DRAFT_252143 [Trichoderma longibrachiatum ATCC 18648]|uniref:Zn(2)-C6 fungal-type domain-containing protein n=1 Tax=Trichoderma longibrachiatum ATCC 18648 TaxID=983965 RepID=A0A2T4C962_TRILO|nr:hypothetical protein M440DRAFT_252143 [Trichoderma longibrachiatum ATCC 18648]
MAASSAAAFPTPSAEAGRGQHHPVLPPYQSQPQSQPQPQSQHQPQFQPPKSQPHPELSLTSSSSTSSSHNQPKQKERQQQQPPSKRRRIGYACNLCRTKKNRCDGERPSCGPCKERRQECVYSPQRTKISVTQEYVCVLIVDTRHLRSFIRSHFIADSKTQWPLCC